MNKSLLPGPHVVVNALVVVIFVLAMGGNNARGQTEVSGTIINETWTPEQAPYLVTGDIRVAGLTIEPGVDVHFTGNYVFEIAGIISAIGTKEDPILFTTDSNVGSWKGLLFQNSAPGSEMTWFVVERANSSGIRIIESFPHLKHFIVRDSQAGDSGAGIKIHITQSRNLDISDCTITNNSIATDHTMPRSNGAGIWVNAVNGTVRFTDCIIENNEAETRDGSILGGGAWINGNVEFFRCRFQGNRVAGHEAIPGGSSAGRGGGVYIASGNVTFLNSIIRDNRAVGTAPGGFSGNQGFASGGGIHINDGEIRIVNSIINDNFASGTHGTRGGGLFVNSGTTWVENSTLVRNNVHAIERNQADVTVINSIIYFNNNNGVQIQGAVAIMYTDVHGGYPGEGNIDFNPIFFSHDSLIIVQGSPAIDAGHPDISYEDECLPPSLGTATNDMGAHGGPGACGWLTEAAHLSPRIAVIPATHDYGSVRIDSSGTKEFVISNVGNADLELSNMTIEGDARDQFEIESVCEELPLTLVPEEDCEVVISFGPTAPGDKDAILRIESNDPEQNPFNVALAGRGISEPAPPRIAVDPASHDYGDVVVGSSVVQSFVVSSTGHADLEVSEITLAGDDADQFEIESICDELPLPLAPDEDCELVVSFNPTSPGAKNAMLRIESNDPDENRLDVHLGGQGVEPLCENVARAASAQVSATGASFQGFQPTAAYLVDGTGLFWSAPGAPAWAQLTLDSTYQANAIRIFSRAFPNELNYNVGISADGTTWTSVFDDWAAGPDSTFTMPGTPWPCHPMAVNEIEFEFRQIRHVRIDITESKAPSSWLWKTDIYEVQIGTPCMPIELTRCDAEVVSIEQDVPHEFALHQNYPNPFNPHTTIRFALPQAAHVTLTIHDLLGREVEVLVSEHLPAGEHQAVWAPRSLPSGVYQYRLDAGSFTQSRSLVFLK